MRISGERSRTRSIGRVLVLSLMGMPLAGEHSMGATESPSDPASHDGKVGEQSVDQENADTSRPMTGVEIPGFRGQ